MDVGRFSVPSSDGGVKSGPIRYFFISAIASSLMAGVRSFASSRDTPCGVNAGGLVGNGCVGYGFSPGTFESVGTGRSSIGHTGTPVTRSNTNANPCLVTWTTASIRLPSTVIVTRLGGDGLS